MTFQGSCDVEPENVDVQKGKTVTKRGGVFASVLCRISQFWPINFVVRSSPTKPCGKGSKRKQDDLDQDEEEEEQLSWVEVLTSQNLIDEDRSVDPDYEVSETETDSEEYQSHNETESDLEVEKGVVVIEDVATGVCPEA